MNNLKYMDIHILYMDFTTVNISKEYLEKLGKLSNDAKRSKTGELHYLIDKECDLLEVDAV